MTLTVPAIADFLHRYRTLQNAAATADLHQFQTRFNQLATTYRSYTAQALAEAQQNAPAFNIFHILGLAYYEVRTHSAFLAHLLNPAAAHGQQHLFLERFLALCRQQAPAFPLPSAPIREGRWQVIPELHTAYGNLDIVIRSPDLSYLCVIENKIYAGEQPEQLQRYAAWLQTQADDYTDQALIYLTPTGAAALTSGDAPYHRLSYRDHLTGWLHSTLAEIAAARVQTVVAQYIDLIRRI